MKNLTDFRKTGETGVDSRLGGGKKEARESLPFPSFLPFYFCARTFSISQTWQSRSLEQATRKYFSANLNFFYCVKQVR